PCRLSRLRLSKCCADRAERLEEPAGHQLHRVEIADTELELDEKSVAVVELPFETADNVDRDFEIVIVVIAAVVVVGIDAERESASRVRLRRGAGLEVVMER